MTIKIVLYIVIIIGAQFDLSSSIEQNEREVIQNFDEIQCTEKGCKGTYRGPEFINRDDIAHQFSNLSLIHI